MNYLAITQASAGWLLGKPGLVDVIHDEILGNSPEIDRLRFNEFVDGPFRMSASPDLLVCALWNVDYLTGTGEESWGFVKLTGDLGLAAKPEISREVLERCFYIISQRLQGLMIDGQFIHRAHSNGAHTCLAGRGTVARQSSIAYFESSADSRLASQRWLVTVGPQHDFNELARHAVIEGHALVRLVEKANALIALNRKKPTADTKDFKNLREALAPYSAVEKPNEYQAVQIATVRGAFEPGAQHRASGLTYQEWLAHDSPPT